MQLHSRIIFFLARWVPGALGIVTTAVLTRLLAPAAYGVYALGLSIVFLLVIGVFEWLGLSVLRMATSTKQPRLFFGTVMTCFYALCGLCAGVFALVLLSRGLQGYESLAAACLVTAFASAGFELKQRLQLAELRESDYFWSNTVRGAFTLILVCTTAYFCRNPTIILLAAGAAIVVAGCFVRDSRLNIMQCRFDYEMYRSLLHYGFPLSISIGLATILMSIDKWLLQALSGPQAVGLFTAASFVAQVPVLALANGIGPSAYSMAVHALEFRSRSAATAQLEQNIVMLLGIVAPGAAAIIALSANLAHLMVGITYWQSVILLAPWLSSAAVLTSIRIYYLDTAFQLAHRTSSLIWPTLITIAVNVGLDLWWIPLLGELGAAVGSCVASFVGLVITAIASRRVFPLPLPIPDSVKVMASVGLMFLVLKQMTTFSGSLALLGQVAAGLLTYTGAAVALNVLGARHLAFHRVGRWLNNLRNRAPDP
jgi:O-antigen/teichoic acid export membrane protein